MKKQITIALLALGLFATTAAFAQDNKEMKSDKKEMKAEKKASKGKKMKATKKSEKMDKKDDKSKTSGMSN